MRIDITFDSWIKEVNENMLRFVGKGTDIISERTWQRWYEDGYTPMQAVETELMNRGVYLDESYYLG
jgi:hypothetical protein